MSRLPLQSLIGYPFTFTCPPPSFQRPSSPSLSLVAECGSEPDEEHRPANRPRQSFQSPAYSLPIEQESDIFLDDDEIMEVEVSEILNTVLSEYDSDSSATCTTSGTRSPSVSNPPVMHNHTFSAAPYVPRRRSSKIIVLHPDDLEALRQKVCKVWARAVDGTTTLLSKMDLPEHPESEGRQALLQLIELAKTSETGCTLEVDSGEWVPEIVMVIIGIKQRPTWTGLKLGRTAINMLYREITVIDDFTANLVDLEIYNPDNYRPTRDLIPGWTNNSTPINTKQLKSLSITNHDCNTLPVFHAPGLERLNLQNISGGTHYVHYHCSACPKLEMITMKDEHPLGSVPSTDRSPPYSLESLHSLTWHCSGDRELDMLRNIYHSAENMKHCSLLAAERPSSRAAFDITEEEITLSITGFEPTSKHLNEPNLEWSVCVSEVMLSVLRRARMLKTFNILSLDGKEESNVGPILNILLRFSPGKTFHLRLENVSFPLHHLHQFSKKLKTGNTQPHLTLRNCTQYQQDAPSKRTRCADMEAGSFDSISNYEGREPGL